MTTKDWIYAVIGLVAAGGGALAWSTLAKDWPWWKKLIAFLCFAGGVVAFAKVLGDRGGDGRRDGDAALSAFDAEALTDAGVVQDASIDRAVRLSANPTGTLDEKMPPDASAVQRWTVACVALKGSNEPHLEITTTVSNVEIVVRDNPGGNTRWILLTDLDRKNPSPVSSGTFERTVKDGAIIHMRSPSTYALMIYPDTMKLTCPPNDIWLHWHDGPDAGGINGYLRVN